MKIDFKLDGTDYRLEIEDAALVTLAGLFGPPVASRAAHSAPAVPSAEMGPDTITGIQVDTKKKDGTPMNSARYTVSFESGQKYSTFDANLGNSAKTLWGMGKKVFYTTKQSNDGKYTNLASVRSAEGV